MITNLLVEKTQLFLKKLYNLQLYVYIFFEKNCIMFIFNQLMNCLYQLLSIISINSINSNIYLVNY